MNRTMAQRRAARALARVREGESRRPAQWQGEYLQYVERLPAAILTGGLGQAAASELAAGRKKEAHKQVYLDLQDWLCGDGGSYHQAVAYLKQRKGAEA